MRERGKDANKLKAKRCQKLKEWRELLFDASGLPKRSATQRELLEYAADLNKYAEDGEYSDAELRREVKLRVKADPLLDYYGSTDGRRHIFFKRTSSQQHGGRYELRPNGEFFFTGGVVTTNEMAALEKGDREKMLPAACQFLFLQGCRLVGYSPTNQTWWAWRPQLNERNEPTEALCQLKIDPDDPDRVISHESEPNTNFLAVSRNMYPFIQRLETEGLLKPIGPLLVPLQRANRKCLSQ